MWHRGAALNADILDICGTNSTQFSRTYVILPRSLDFSALSL